MSEELVIIVKYERCKKNGLDQLVLI